jgi:hypothetical protein
MDLFERKIEAERAAREEEMTPAERLQAIIALVTAGQGRISPAQAGRTISGILGEQAAAPGLDLPTGMTLDPTFVLEAIVESDLTPEQETAALEEYPDAFQDIESLTTLRNQLVQDITPGRFGQSKAEGGAFRGLFGTPDPAAAAASVAKKERMIRLIEQILQRSAPQFSRPAVTQRGLREQRERAFSPAQGSYYGSIVTD